MSFLLPIQLFKILADETRLGIVLLLSELESYASVISALLSTSRSPRSPAIWRFFVKAVCCWIASRVSGFITAYHRIFHHGPRKLLSRPGDANRKRFR